MQFAGILFDVVHELFEILSRYVRVNDKHVGHLGQQRHRHKVAAHVIGLVIQHVGIDGQRAHMAENDGVTVRG
jgi:hypothetical protein